MSLEHHLKITMCLEHHLKIPKCNNNVEHQVREKTKDRSIRRQRKPDEQNKQKIRTANTLWPGVCRCIIMHAISRTRNPSNPVCQSRTHLTKAKSLITPVMLCHALLPVGGTTQCILCQSFSLSGLDYSMSEYSFTSFVYTTRDSYLLFFYISWHFL